MGTVVPFGTGCFSRTLLPFTEEPPSLETDDLECRQVVVPALVDAVMAEVDESFLDEERLESEEGFLVTVHEFLLRPAIRKGNPHPIALTESERDEL